MYSWIKKKRIFSKRHQYNEYEYKRVALNMIIRGWLWSYNALYHTLLLANVCRLGCPDLPQRGRGARIRQPLWCSRTWSEEKGEKTSVSSSKARSDPLQRHKRRIVSINWCFLIIVFSWNRSHRSYILFVHFSYYSFVVCWVWPFFQAEKEEKDSSNLQRIDLSSPEVFWLLDSLKCMCIILKM